MDITTTIDASALHSPCAGPRQCDEAFEPTRCGMTNRARSCGMVVKRMAALWSRSATDPQLTASPANPSNC